MCKSEMLLIPSGIHSEKYLWSIYYVQGTKIVGGDADMIKTWTFQGMS